MKANEEEWNKVWTSNSIMYKLLNWARFQLTKGLYKRVFKQVITPKTRLLEVGCGSSTTSLYLCPKIRSFTGLDISSEALKLSKRKAKEQHIHNASFIKGSGFKMPFKTDSFDIVWSHGLLEHFDNPQGILDEKIRVCKIGGCIITSLPAYWSYHKLWYIITRIKFLRKLWLWTDQTFYTKKMLNSLIKKHNVKVIGTFHYPLYGLIIQVLLKN